MKRDDLQDEKLTGTSRCRRPSRLTNPLFWWLNWSVDDRIATQTTCYLLRLYRSTNLTCLLASRYGAAAQSLKECPYRPSNHCFVVPRYFLRLGRRGCYWGKPPNHPGFAVSPGRVLVRTDLGTLHPVRPPAVGSFSSRPKMPAHPSSGTPVTWENNLAHGVSDIQRDPSLD